MIKQYINIEQHTIAYTVRNEDRLKTIFLLHGNSTSSEIWDAQINSPLLKDFKIIAFDLPGHGMSEHNLAPEQVYNVIEMSNIMSTCIRKLANNDPFIVIGLSLGTNLIGEMINEDFIPAGIVLISPTVVGQKITPADLVTESAAATVLYEDAPDKKLVDAYLQETMHTNNPELCKIISNDYYRVKPFFRSSLRASIPAQLYSDEVSNLLGYQNPVLCIVGAQDRITNPDLMTKADLNYWKQHIILVEEAGHLVCMDQPEKVSALIFEYSDEMTK